MCKSADELQTVFYMMVAGHQLLDRMLVSAIQIGYTLARYDDEVRVIYALSAG